MIIFDLDGTLSIVGDRIKFLQQDEKDWDSFYSACDQDEVNEPIAMLFRQLAFVNVMKIVTGRRESCRGKTLKWLSRNFIQIDTSNLHMRSDGDHRHDTLVKPELVKDFIRQIDMVFEDRNSMVAKWRELGIPCCQVADGDF